MSRLERERSFQNSNVAEHTRAAARKYYAVTNASTHHYRARLAELAPGRRALEYGCGSGAHAFMLAELGAEVVGIDIADHAIRVARETARNRALHSLRFEVMNAEDLSFPDGSFDVVCGTAILHHLDFRRALSEVARVLKPTGSAIFIEPLGHNPALRLYRYLTPSLRTRDEHPFRVSDFAVARELFGTVQTTSFHMLSLAAVPLRKLRGFDRVVRALDAADAAVFRLVPYMRRHAWCAVLELTEPNRLR